MATPIIIPLISVIQETCQILQQIMTCYEQPGAVIALINKIKNDWRYSVMFHFRRPAHWPHIGLTPGVSSPCRGRRKWAGAIVYTDLDNVVNVMGSGRPGNECARSPWQ
jgi:hypothetical protein